MSKKINCPGVCSACATINAENERLRQKVASIERMYEELKQARHTMVYGGYVHPSYWTDGRERRRQWAQQGLEDTGHAECVAAAKEAM